MARHADESPAVPVDDGYFEPVLAPERLLQAAAITERERNVRHAAVPPGIVGNDRLQAGKLLELLSGVLRQFVRMFLESRATQRGKEINRGGNGQKGAALAGATPDEFVGPGGAVLGKDAAPTQQGRAN